MNDLPWIKYKPSVMFIDLIGLSAWAKVAHVALFNYTLINDGPPLNENEALRDITGCPASDWGRVKRELIGKGWVETPKFFLHRGTIKTLNESKETFVGNQNQTAQANRKTTRLILLPPDPESGVVTYCETPSVTHDVTPHVTPGQRQVQEDEGIKRESRHQPEANIPSWNEVKTWAELDAITESEARAFFDHYEGNNLWQNKHGRAVNARVCLKIYANNARKVKPNANTGKYSPKSVDRNAGTANAGRSKDYATAAERV